MVSHKQNFPFARAKLKIRAATQNTRVSFADDFRRDPPPPGDARYELQLQTAPDVLAMTVSFDDFL